MIFQHVQANLDLELPVKDEREPDMPIMPMPEAWSEADADEPWEDALGWETHDDDEGVSDLTIFYPRSSPPMDEQLESTREVVARFEQRNIVFSDDELPTLEERSCPLIIPVDVNNCSLPRVLVDTGASRNVCSLSTLNYLYIEESDVTRLRFACAAYDNSQREAIGTV